MSEGYKVGDTFTGLPNYGSPHTMASRSPYQPTPDQRKMLEQIVGRELKSGEPLWPIMFAALDAIGQRLLALEVGGRPSGVLDKMQRPM